MTSLQTRGSTDVSPRSAALRGVHVVLHVNGRQRLLQLDRRVTLLDALRENLDLVSTKEGLLSRLQPRRKILSKEVRESHALQGFR